jgi:pyruvate dehydrogenase E2 component (dihydrolipoamide acetyltransferase)
MDKYFYDITMPSLGADMTEGTLVEWLINIGDEVKKSDIVAVIETQKGAIDMEVHQEGTVSEILVQPVTKVPVGAVLARLKTNVEVVVEEADAGKDAASVKSESPAEYMENSKIGMAIPASAVSVVSSPVVRKIAQEQQLDLSNIKGSGPSGAILLRDIESALSVKSESVTPAEAMRAAIARAMEKSKKEIPHYYITLDINISHVQQWLQKENADKEPEQRMLLLAVLLKAVATTLIKYPQLNGYYLDGQYRPCKSINIGNAISLREGGLMVPAIHDVEQMSLTEIMDAIREISSRSRGGHLRSSELMDATITITSMGERGSDSVLGVIYPPQVAIIGFGKPRQMPQVRESDIVVCDVITTSLSADHRVSDGIVGAKFLNALSKKLQKPELL